MIQYDFRGSYEEMIIRNSYKITIISVKEFK